MPELSGEDPSVDVAVERIMAKGADALGDVIHEDLRENRTDREPHERDEGVEVEDERASDEAEETPQAAEDAEEQFLEIPRGEGEDPERIPVAEALQAVQQLRQMEGQIADAITKAEVEYMSKQDEIIQGIGNIYQDIATKGQTALELIQSFMPQPPSTQMLDRNSEYYDPQGYYEAKAHHDKFMERANQVYATVKGAMEGRQQVAVAVDQTELDRENQRLARYIPEWKDPETRAAKRAEIEGVLTAKYGLTKDDFESVGNHKAWRMMADLAKLSQVNAKAPEVKKTVQEKAPKLVNGRLPPRETGTGRFVSEDRKALRETGSEDAFARMLIRSGSLKGL